MAAENSPYYESASNWDIQIQNRTNLSVYLLNGWQRICWYRIQKCPHSVCKSNYKASKKLLLNYSNFIGSVQPDSNRAFRTFHNLYAIYEPTNKWGVTALDIGNR
ncbi:MAG: outer membrane beta-barrel protein [Bacteroidetes bacterium]|nr:outer membrane beta-barrel protein [Bacteroidota bacterium]